MKQKKKPLFRWYLSLILLGLSMLFLWPRLVTATPLTPKHHLERAWHNADQVGHYQYQTTVIQTTHPTARLDNLGRRSTVEYVDVVGQIDRQAELMQLQLWPEGRNKPRTVDLKLEKGITYGRSGVDEVWQVLDDSPIDIFAPGGDPLGFLVAVENVRPAGPAGEADLFPADMLPDDYAGRISRYQFELDGLRYARFMRGQMEDYLRHKGELPPGLSLDLNRQYVDMVGRGEIWLDSAGLPVRQIIQLEFPPERGAGEWVEAKISTGFSNWGSEAGPKSQWLTLPARLWQEPAWLIKDPTALLPAAYAPTPENLQTFGLIVGLALLMTGLVLLAITQRKSAKFYAAVASVAQQLKVVIETTVQSSVK